MARPIVVIGTGLAGSLAALALARRGGQVTLVGPGTDLSLRPTATALSYGSMAGWRAGLRWRCLQRRHGPLGWQPSRLVLHRGEGEVAPAARLAPLVPFSRVDARELAVRLPAVLSRAGVSLLEAQVEDLSPLAGGAWRLRIRRTADPADRQEIGAVQVVLAAGPHCRALWPTLPSRLRASWAGVLLLPGNPGGSVWLERVHRGWVVQPARWKRPDLERTVDDHPGERWIVDAGLAPWGEGVLLGQITLVQPGPGPPPPPDPVLMEQRLREGLELLDPRLATCNAAYHQVQVPFSPDGQPLVGPVGGVDNLWIFSGFSGAFAAVPPQAERLARALLPQRADARAPARGGGTA